MNRNTAYFVVAAVAVSIGITLPRLLPGIPMSIDTTSHLYRVLFLQQWFKQGIFPFWSSDWYAGSPAVLLYPPLGYYISVGLSIAGLDPLSAYKTVDAVFYWLAPIAVYFLGKELGFSKGESALGALLFSVVPEVIENYLFYDRFPTVISIPIFCAFLIMLHRALVDRNQRIYLLGSVFSMSALLLTHHLSALIAGIVAVLFLILAFGREGIRKPLGTLLAVGIGTLGLTAFWLVPFIRSVQLFSANEFYNRNVIFPFLRFTYFGVNVTSYLLGIAQFILAVVGVQVILTKIFARKLRVNAILFFPILFAGMILFQEGEITSSLALKGAGEILVVGSFVIFLGQFLVFRDARKVLSKHDGILFAVIWFVVFLWIGLGYYALPILRLPYLADIWIRTMDVYRIWLYLGLPMCMLAARGFLRSMITLRARKPALVLLLLALTITPIALSAGLKANFVFNSRVNPILPYTAGNAEIPKEVIDYFNNDPSQGRILGISVPLWIYVLPNYVGKPIIDGWYPQSKLVTQLVRINDYRLDDLETTNDTARLDTWKTLIASSRQLDVTWVMIGTQELASDMVDALSQAEFTKQLTVPYQMTAPFQGGELVIFKAQKVPSYVDAPEGFVQRVARPNPDKIMLNTSPSSRTTTIVVKEAYFPTWAAEADGKGLTVEKQQSTGFIMLEVPPDTHNVTLYQASQSSLWSIVSSVSLTICLALSVILLIQKRRSG